MTTRASTEGARSMTSLVPEDPASTGAPPTRHPRRRNLQERAWNRRTPGYVAAHRRLCMWTVFEAIIAVGGTHRLLHSRGGLIGTDHLVCFPTCPTSRRGPRGF